MYTVKPVSKFTSFHRFESIVLSLYIYMIAKSYMPFELKMKFRQGFTILSQLNYVHRKALYKVYFMLYIFILYMISEIIYAFWAQYELKTGLYYT